MESIIACAPDAIATCIAPLDLTPLPNRERGRLWLAPETFLSAIHAHSLAAWAVARARLLSPPALPRGPGGRPPLYRDETVLLLAATLFGLKVAIVYADAAYFDQRFRAWVRRFLQARTAVDYNPRRKGKRQLASRTFMRYWRHCMLGPRAVIERHFAWVKHYFGLKAFQCCTCVRVYQYVLLTYCCVVGVALAASRYQRLDLIHQRSAVLAVKTP